MDGFCTQPPNPLVCFNRAKSVWYPTPPSPSIMLGMFFCCKETVPAVCTRGLTCPF
jgi:hypothetical protein